MKVLTIRQPWATLIMLGYKRFEFRGWPTKYRGELLIHAGKTVDKEASERLEKYFPSELPLGKILGKVNLVDCIKCDEKLKSECLKENPDVYAKSSFEERYAWQLTDVQVFEEPIEVNGKLGLWNYEL